jgi:hypothetical protein
MPWPALKQELDRWHAEGRAATLWWRDDDACSVTAALDQLLMLRHAAGVPLALAVIPACADERLAKALPETGVDVLQHGLLHRNHAPPGHAKAEFGRHRPRALMAAEVREGWERLANFRAALPVFVPPWNRIDHDLAAALPGLGIAGLSTDRPRKPAPPGLTVANSHVDIMAWNTRQFAGDGVVLAEAMRHLADRRSGRADPDEPTGLLTHHLAHDASAWDFIRRFLEATAAHPAVRYLSAREIFTTGAR